MSKNSRTLTLVATLFFALIIVFLFSGPHYFSSSVSFLDTELSQSSGNEEAVRVKMDFGRQSALDNFPYQIDQWAGIDEDAEGIKESLGAQTLIKRAYTSDNPFQPVFLLIMQSASKASFHPPIVCYPALGYDIEDETKDMVRVTDTSWVDKWFERDIEDMPEWIQEDWKSTARYGEISVKKLIVTHKDRTDRRIVLYIYIKDKNVTSDTVSMLRVSTLAPSTGSCEAASERAIEFMGDVIPLLFEPEQQGQKMFITYLVEMGIGGYFIIIALFSLPAGILLFPIAAKRKNRNLSSQ